MLKVSVIIPTYNRSHLLPRAIDSVLSQTFTNFELIIIDDGSTDGTKEVVSKYQKKDNRIKYIKHEINMGGNKARNTGIKSSRGDYISFLDSDDEWLPNKLEKQLNIFKKSKNQNLGFVYCRDISIKNNKKSYNKNQIYSGNILKNLLADNFICGGGSSNLIKKECFDNCELFDETEELRIGGSQEYEMFIRIAKCYEFDFVDEFLIKYYIHDNSITQKTKIFERCQAKLYVLNKHKELFIKLPKVYSSKLRYFGNRYMLLNNKKKARKYFLKSIKTYPLNISSYVSFILSFMNVKISRALFLVKGNSKKNL